MTQTILSNQRMKSAAAQELYRRKPRWRRTLFWAVAVFLVALLLSGAGTLWLRMAARAELPQLDGAIHLAGFSSPVVVRRDAHGVPHIDAATQDDLFVAQGYVTAQDRLWQMDSFRRYANGDLAQIMGPTLLKHDETQRVLQIRRTAQRIYANLPAADRARFDDYARGVNLYIAQCEESNSLPVEFKLLVYKPQLWTGVDSISVGLMEVQELDTHTDTKLSREKVAAKLNHNEKLLADLYPVGSWRDHPPTGIDVDLSQPHPLPPVMNDEDDEEDDENTEVRTAPLAPESPIASTTLLRSSALLTRLGLPACDGCGLGSNEWVASGTRTASGKPLLANDMHLSLTVPNVWYIVDLRAPGYHAAGVTLPGMPFIVAGHNEHVAWGFTALYGDVQDLYYEKLDGKGNYEGLDAQWHPLAIDREVIHVRGGNDVVLDVQSTAHGPLMNPVLPHETPPIALKWTLYDPTLNAIPLYQVNVASNWSEFSAALAAWCWPTQNVVYADDQGHIAYHAVGRIPARRGGMRAFDTPLRHDELNLRFEWGVDTLTNTKKKGAQNTPIASVDTAHPYIPFDQMPNVFDAPSGFLATANSRVTINKGIYGVDTNDMSAIPITDNWIDPYRIERIYKALDGRNNLTAKDMLTAQTDIYSEVDQELGQRFAYAIDHTPGPEGNGDVRLCQAADLMRNWDGRLTTDSAAASLVTEARAALWPLILKPRLGNLWRDYHWGESNFAEEEIVMHAKPEWLPPGYKDWNALLTAAVREGMRSGKAPSDVPQWTYGSWHVIDLAHPLAKFLPLIGSIAGTGPQPMSGDTTTVKQISATVGPSQRFTMDWSNIDGSTENIVLGESGNPLSPYFRDQWSAWDNGTTFSLPFSPAAVAAQTSHTLRLLP
jgi:penicillin amidase